MVGKIIARFLRKAGYEVRRIGDPLPIYDKLHRLTERVNRLDEKLIELDSVICTTMECVEEIRDAQQAVVPTGQNKDSLFADTLNEYLYGYQQRSDDE